MVDSGKASKRAMLEVINDIDKYSMYVKKELELLYNESSNLSDLWKDNKFTNFMECVEKMKQGVEHNLEKIDEAKYVLKEKVGMM